jgi:hypothetical protein
MLNIWIYIIICIVAIVFILQYFFETRKKPGYLILLCFLASIIAQQIFYYIECTLVPQCKAGALSIIGDVIFILIVFVGSVVLNVLISPKKHDN